MAQPGTAHIEVVVDATAARKAVKRILRDAQEANRLLAVLEDRCRELEERLAAEYGIKTIREDT